MFQAFLSHNSADKPAVEQLARRLEKDGISCFLDKWHLIPGEPWQPALEDAIDQSATCVVFVGPSGLGPWQNEEMRAAISRRVSDRTREFRVVPVVLPNAKRDQRSRLPRFLVAATWVEFSQSLDDEDAIHRLKCGIRGVPPGQTPSEALYVGECPYRGLQVFDSQHANFFFGRDGQVDWVIERLAHDFGTHQENRFLGVVGASGSGKSSLVRAGLVPALQQGHSRNGKSISSSAKWPIVMFKPGSEPLKALADALWGHDLAQPVIKDTLQYADQLKADERRLHATIGTILHKASEATRYVIVVDQFEELFTLCPAEAEQERLSFIDNLLYASTVMGGKTIVLTTMRADFYGKCTKYERLAHALSEEQELVPPLGQSELRDAIEHPAQLCGLELETGLTAMLLQDMRQQPAGALPLLQQTLLMLWERRDGRRLTVSAYKDIGEIEGALEAHANKLYNEQLKTNEERDACRRILLMLTTPGEGTEDTRRRIDRAQLSTGHVVDSVLETLSNGRLVTVGETEPVQIEVAHESLIRGWRRLRDWLDQDRESLRVLHRLSDAAKEWQANNNDRAFLYTGSRLTLAEEWAEEHRSELSDLPLAEEFLTKSIDERDLATRKREAEEQQRLELLQSVAEAEREKAHAEKGKTEKQRLITRILICFSSVAILLAAFALWAYRDAKNSRDTLERTAGDLETVEVELTSKKGDLKTAQENLKAAEAKTNQLTKIQTRLQQEQIRLQKEQTRLRAGARIAEADALRQAERLVDAENAYKRAIDLYEELEESSLPALLGLSQLHRDHPQHINRWFASFGVGGAEFSPDGRHFVFTSSNERGIAIGEKDPIQSEIAVRRISDGEDVWHVSESTFVLTAVFSPTGDLVAHSRRNELGRSAVVLRDAKTGREITELFGHSGDIRSLVFSPDGKLLGSGSEDNTVVVWNLEERKQLRAFSEGHTEGVDSIAISPDGNMLATESDKTLRLWSLDSGELLHAMEHPSWIRSVCFSPDSSKVATYCDKMVWLWDVTSARQIRNFPSGEHDELHFGVDGKHVLSAGFDGAMWNLESGKRVSSFPLTDPRGGSSTASIDISPDGRFLLAAKGRHFDLWTIPPGNEIVASKAHQSKVSGTAVSTSGHFGLSCSDDGTAQVFDIATGSTIRTLYGVPPHFTLGYQPQSIAFTPDDMFVVASIGGKDLIWDMSNGKQIAAKQFVLQHCDEEFELERFLPGGRFMVIEDDSEKEVRQHLWDLAKGKSVHVHTLGSEKSDADDILARIMEQSAFVFMKALSPDQQYAVVQPKEIEVWNLKTGNRTPIAAGRDWSNLGTAAAFSSDSRHFVTSQTYAPEGTPLELWDSESGKRIRTFDEKNGAETATFVANDKYLLTKKSSSLTLWDVDSGREVSRFPANGFTALSPNEQVLVSGGGFAGEHETHVLDLSRPHAYREFESKLGIAPKGLATQFWQRDRITIAKWYAFHGGFHWAIELLEAEREAGNDVPLLLLARCYWMTDSFGKAEQAVSDAHKSQAINETTRVLLLRGIAHSRSLEQLANARQLLAEGEYEAALTKANEVVNDTEDLPEAYVIRAGANHRIGKNDVALVDIERVLGQFTAPDDLEKDIDTFLERKSRPSFTDWNTFLGDVHLLRALVLEALGKTDEASKDFARASLYSIALRDEFEEKGTNALTESDWATAIDEFTIAIKMRAGMNTLSEWASLLGRSEARLQIGDDEGAEDDLQEALRYIERFDHDAWNMLRVARFLAKRATALRDKKKLAAKDIELAGEYLQKLFKYQWTTDHWKNFKLESDDEFASIRESPRFEAVVALFDAYDHLKAGRDTEAESRATTAIELSPNFSGAYFARALFRAKGGNASGAITDYGRVIELDPGNSLAHYNLACRFSVQSVKQPNTELGRVRRAELIDKAFVHLDKAIEAGFEGRKQMLADDELESIRNDPRFGELLKRI